MHNSCKFSAFFGTASLFEDEHRSPSRLEAAHVNLAGFFLGFHCMASWSNLVGVPNDLACMLSGISTPSCGCEASSVLTIERESLCGPVNRD